MTFADRLEELRKKATPGTWRVAEHRTHGRRCFAKRITLTPDNARGDIANIIAGLGSLDTNVDAEFICFLANNADAILELVRAAEVMVGHAEGDDLDAELLAVDALAKLNGEQT